jgi:hypothetical protein
MKRPLHLVVITLLLAAPAVDAQRRATEVAVIDGDPVYRLLPVGGIPAIDEPAFVTGDAADAQMVDHEPVIGVVVDGHARAYSLWHLDAHEIVNDEIEGTAIAATW